MTAHPHYLDAHDDAYSKTILGFWVYLLTDFMMFAVLFATYAVLHRKVVGEELFNLPYTLLQTLLLLISSFTIGFGGVFAHRRQKNATIAFFGITFLLGAAFMGMELAEGARLVSNGYSWEKNASLSTIFTLIGTHGLHVVFALLWIIVLILPVWRDGLTAVSIKRLTCLRMFWQFINVVWVFIFTIVYLMGGQGYA